MKLLKKMYLKKISSNYIFYYETYSEIYFRILNQSTLYFSYIVISSDNMYNLGTPSQIFLSLF